MIRTVLRGITIVVALTTVMIVINAPSRVVASPPSNVEWKDYQGKIRDAEMRGDFAVAEEVSRDFYARCRTALGETHPATTVVAASVRAYHKLQSLDEQAKRQFTTATTTRNAAWQRVVDNTKETIPTLDSMTELLSSFHTCSRGFPPDLPREADSHADCDGGIGRLLALARMFETAESYMASAYEYYLSTEGLEFQTKGIELALAEMLREQEKDPARRVAASQII